MYRRLVPLAVASTAIAAPPLAQDWRLLASMRQTLASSAYDAWRARVVAVGDRGETREWDGTRWLHRPIPSLPSPPMAMAFDSTRGVTVALLAALPAMRTWEFDGSSWTERITTNAPPARTSCAMAFDAQRNRTVVFGGGPLAANDDTWEWNGAVWQLLTPATRPLPRLGSAMAFDLVRGRCVLFGGSNPAAGTFGTYYNDTWEWDGFAWTPRAPLAAPTPRAYHALCYDAVRQVTVMSGSHLSGPPETYEYDGTTWTQRTGLMPPQRSYGTLAFDAARGRSVLFGGQQIAPLQDLWELDASGWQQRLAASEPDARTGCAVAHVATRDRTVLFGGYGSAVVHGDTWEWDGRVWSLAQPSVSPPARSKHAMWSDGSNAFVFGGLDATYAFRNDTWRFDGTLWSAVPSSAPPPPRQFHAVAFDPTNGGALLFGGRSPANVDLGDTWRLGANGWFQVTSVPTPSPRSGAAIAADLARQRVVLWGGVGPGGALLDDTWEWNGTSWLLRVPAHRPIATGVHAMTFEPSFGVTVLLARASQFDPRLVVWLWNGVDWSPLATPTTIDSSSWMTAAAASGALRYHDGNHLWELTDLPPQSVRYGSACGTPPPRLDADAWPRPGAAEFALSYAAHAPFAPIATALSTASIQAPLAGCTLLVQPDGPLLAGSANAFGAAAWSLPLPPLPGLLGYRFFAQAWSLCPAGICATAGLALTIGR